MSEDLQEQACWLLLAFECGLNTHIVHNILEAWCYQDNRSLEEFFTTNQHEWNDICNLNTENMKKLEQAKEKLAGQAFLIEQLSHEHIHMLTVLDAKYPRQLKSSLKREQLPPILFYAGEGVNVISGNARGVGRTAYEGATSTQGCTTVVLPHGIRKLSGAQWRALLEKIEAGQVLVLSQEKSDAALHADQLSLFGATGE